MAKINQPIIRVVDLAQAGYVVRDCEKSALSMWENFGIGPWRIDSLSPGFMATMTNKGKPARFGIKAACTINRVGGFEIELIEPTEGDSIYRDFLKEHGEGLHHLGWHKVSSMEDFNQTSQALEKAGYPCVVGGTGPGVAFSYFDTTKSLHTILEVTWIDPLVATPPPVLRILPEQKKK